MPDLKKLITLEALQAALPSWLKSSSKPSYTADEISDTNTTNKFVTSTEKNTWNAKGTYSKPTGGIPKSDLSQLVQNSLDLADSALQSESDPTVPSWAKQTNKPSYTQDEVPDGTTYKRVTQTEKNAWSGKQNALTTTQINAVNSGINSTKVGQISTNQTNISLVEDMICDTEFSTSTAYVVGDIVTHENGLYEFTSAHSAGAWNSADVTQIDVVEYVDSQIPTVMGASGSSHKGGLVPDTPSTPGTTKFLREDGTWEVPSGGGGGAVNTVYIDTTQYPPDSSGKVVLPAYPTTLPANGGTASNVSGTVAILNGGTGATNQSDARTNLGLGSAATKSSTSSVTSGSTSLITSGGVYTALSGKQNTISDLSTIRSGAAAGATALQPSDITTLSDKVDTLYRGIVLVAYNIASGVTASISYTAKGNDFNTGASGSKYSGTYLLSCVNWATTPQAYLGLIAFTGNKPETLFKADIVTGFTPTISLTGGTISVSGCGRISLYAIK